LIDGLIANLIFLFVGWLVDWFVGWLVGLFVGWLVAAIYWIVCPSNAGKALSPVCLCQCSGEERKTWRSCTVKCA